MECNLFHPAEFLSSPIDVSHGLDKCISIYCSSLYQNLTDVCT